MRALSLMVLLMALGCSEPRDEVGEPSAGGEQITPRLREHPATPEPTHAIWQLRTRYRLADADGWRELDPSVTSGPLVTEVIVSGGHDIGEMGRWLGCDLAIAGERATISCGDLTTRTQSAMTVSCESTESMFRFDRAEPLEGGIEIRVKCDRGTLE